MKSFILMIQFMTRIPIPIEIKMEKQTISRGIFFFPFIGMMVGAISWGLYFLFGFINHEMGALGAVAGMLIATGGLHADGLSDTFDGFFSARSREKILEIMKDSRTGTFGVIAIVFDLLSRYIMIKNLDPAQVFLTLILLCGSSRLGAAMLITFGKSARKGGLGELFSASAGKVYFLISAAAYIAAGFFLAGLSFLILLSAMLLFCLVLMQRSYKIIGGLTGDVYGAAIELSEIIGLITVMAVGKWISF